MVVNQFTVIENHQQKRPDIMLCVNGIPLMVSGVMTFVGAVLLALDLLTIGARESRDELVIEEY